MLTLKQLYKTDEFAYTFARMCGLVVRPPSLFVHQAWHNDVCGCSTARDFHCMLDQGANGPVPGFQEAKRGVHRVEHEFGELLVGMSAYVLDLTWLVQLPKSLEILMPGKRMCQAIRRVGASVPRLNTYKACVQIRYA